MLLEILRNSKNKWLESLKKINHPFRSFVLSTIDSNRLPQSRNVILRNFNSKKITFSIYSDYRSNKVKNLNNSSIVELLFYDSIELVQIVVRAELIKKSFDEKVFNSLSIHSKKNYISVDSPGTVIDNPNEIKYGKENYFCQLVFKAKSIEYLQLNKNGNIRCFFDKKKSWKGVFLTP